MTQPIEQLADLISIGAGAAAEKFAAEFERVLENVRDPNTDAKATRKIVLEFTFKPDEDRERLQTAIVAKTTLASTKPTGDFVWVASREGEVVATVVHHPRDLDPRQGILPLHQSEGGPTP